MTTAPVPCYSCADILNGQCSVLGSCDVAYCPGCCGDSRSMANCGLRIQYCSPRGVGCSPAAAAAADGATAGATVAGASAHREQLPISQSLTAVFIASRPRPQSSAQSRSACPPAAVYRRRRFRPAAWPLRAYRAPSHAAAAAPQRSARPTAPAKHSSAGHCIR